MLYEPCTSARLLFYFKMGNSHVPSLFFVLAVFTFNMPFDTGTENRRRELYRRLLHYVEITASVVTSIADGPLNVPFLKSAADLVHKIIVAARVCASFVWITCKLILLPAQTANENQDACDDLVQQVADYLGIITDGLKGKADIGAAFHSSIIAFTQYVL